MIYVQLPGRFADFVEERFDQLTDDVREVWLGATVTTVGFGSRVHLQFPDDGVALLSLLRRAEDRAMDSSDESESGRSELRAAEDATLALEEAAEQAGLPLGGLEVSS